MVPMSELNETNAEMELSTEQLDTGQATEFATPKPISGRGSGRSSSRGRKRGRPAGSRNIKKEPAVSPKKQRKPAASKEQDEYEDLFAFQDDNEEEVVEDDTDAAWTPDAEAITASKGSRGGRRSARLAKNATPDVNQRTDEEYDSSDDEEEIDSVDDEEYDDQPSDVNLFAEASGVPVKKDIYDFDAQSVTSGTAPSPVGARRSSRRRRTAGQVADAPTAAVPANNWGSNIYSSLAAYMKTRQEMDCYNALISCSKLNSALDQTMVKLCQPNAAHSSLFYGPGASLQSLLARIASPDRIFSILSNLVSKAQEDLSHRIVYYVPVLFSSIFSFDFYPTALESMNTIDNQIILNYAMLLDNDVNFISNKFNLFRNSEDVKNVVVADDVYEVFNDLVWSDRPSTCRLVVSMNADRLPTCFFILDTWKRAEVPLNRDRVEPPQKLSEEVLMPGRKPSQTEEKSLEQDLQEYLDEMIAWVELQSDSPTKESRQHDSRSKSVTSILDVTLCDAFIVKPYGKKDTVLLIVCVKDSLVVFNIISEQRFVFARHGLNKQAVVNMENGHTVYPDQLVDERSLLVVPDEMYSALKENYSGIHMKSSKFVILDIDKRTPLGAAEDFEADVCIQYETHTRTSLPPPAYFNTPVTPEDNTGASNTRKKENFKLVVINGILLGLKIDAQKVLRSAVEIVPLKAVQAIGTSQVSIVTNPNLGAWDFKRSCLSTVRITTEKNASTVNFHGYYVTRFDSTLQSALLSYNMDLLSDLVFDMPVEYSLYDVIFRLAQASLPQSLCASNADGSSAEQALFCVFCIRETRQAHQNFAHEMRHLDLPKRFHCHEHNKVFMEYRGYRQHLRTQHNAQENEEADALEAAEENDQNPLLLAGAKVLRNRMDGPQCEKCRDYFPNMSAMQIHSPVCDGISFSQRTPFPLRKARPGSHTSMLICGVCGRALLSRDHMRYHLNSVHNQCRLCQEQIADVLDLSKHYADHYNRILLVPEKEMNKIMYCKVCQDYYSTRHDFYFHQWAVHGIQSTTDVKSGELDNSRSKRPYHRLQKDDLSYVATGAKREPCKLCQVPIRVMGTEYQRHLATKHGIEVDNNLVCRICFEIYDDANKLSDHLAAEHFASGEYFNAGIQTIYRCDKCTFMGFQKNLFMHALSVHNDAAPLMYECMTCSERFPDRRLWRQHLEKHVEGYAYECQLCNQAFRARYALHVHMRNYHAEDEDNADVGPMKCDYCDNTFPAYSALRDHISTDHPEAQLNTEFECPICRRAFVNGEDLQRHERAVHSGACKCDICGKLFANQRAHQRHRVKHFRARMFQCTDCMATFKSKLSMKRHIRVEHLLIGPEKFECQICGKIVSQISMHMLTHKEARFECEYCGRRFTKSCYYNEHVRIHKGERPYGCHICEMRFNKKSNLNVHLRMHEKHKDADGNYLEIPPKGRGSSTIRSMDPFAVRKLCTTVCVGTSDFVDMADFRERTKSCDTSDLHLWAADSSLVSNGGESSPPVKRFRGENGVNSNATLTTEHEKKFTKFL